MFPPLNEDVRLPNGVMVRIRVPDPADRSGIDQLAADADAIRVGPPLDVSAAGGGSVVAEQPWGGGIVAHAAWGRLSGPRAVAAVMVAREYARTPLVAHLLVRLTRLADAALLPALVTTLDPAEPSARFVAEVFGVGSGEVELRTEEWQEALARVQRIARVSGALAPSCRHGVVIAGGGVAALECLMALRDLAGPELPIRLVAPTDVFVYRPLLVAEPFSLEHAHRYPLAGIATDFGAELIAGAVAEVRAPEHEVVMSAGAVLPYDALVLAPGARPVPVFPGAIAVGQEGAAGELRGLLGEIERGDVRDVAFVAPGDTAWTLPLYELALMTARRTGARISLVTPELRPLAIFGPPASARIAELLAAAGIAFVGSSYASARPGGLALEPGGRTLAADRVVALPALRGPALTGVPADASGFIPTDPYGRVTRVESVFAAGDATAFPVKQGGLAAQQADAVAESVAAALGAPVAPRLFRPVLRGLLYTGGEDRFLRAGIGGGEGDAAVATDALWWPPTKVAGLYLAPYLFTRDHGGAVGEPPSGFATVAVPLDRPGVNRPAP